jgi:hypothetical protein
MRFWIHQSRYPRPGCTALFWSTLNVYSIYIIHAIKEQIPHASNSVQYGLPCLQ